MKRGATEKPGVLYAWMIQNARGYLLAGYAGSTRQAVIDKLLRNWGPAWTWPKARKQGLKIVWVKIEVISK